MVQAGRLVAAGAPAGQARASRHEKERRRWGGAWARTHVECLQRRCRRLASAKADKAVLAASHLVLQGPGGMVKGRVLDTLLRRR